MSYNKMRGLFPLYVDLILIFTIDFIISIDFTKFGTIYNIDTNIFPYFYTEVSYRYLSFAIYGLNPWTMRLGGFDLGNFLINIPIWLFSNIPLSGLLYVLFLMYIGSSLIYLLIKDILHDESSIARFSSILGSIFFVLAPNSGEIYGSLLEVIYLYYLSLPLSIFILRKYFMTEKFSESLFFFLLFIPIFMLIFYYSIPDYALPTIILFSIMSTYYGVRSLLMKKIGRVILFVLSIFLFVILKYNTILSTYDIFVSDSSFINLSYYYWVSNSYGSPLYLTLRGLNANFGFPALYIQISSLTIPIIYFFVLFNKKTNKNYEVLLFLSLILIFSFLYSMPNVPFPSFWEKLFFKFPIMTDLRTQYVIIAPFQGLVFSYGIGFGSYALFDLIGKGKVLKIISAMVLLLSILVIQINVLIHGGSYVIVPSQFLGTVNFINTHSSETSSVIIFPVFPTENSEQWYHGPSLFPLFLKSNVILGGYYYSQSSTIRGIIATIYHNVYYGNMSVNDIRYFENFMYMLNIHYIIVEKDAIGYGPLGPCPPNYNLDQLLDGITKYENAGLIRMVYNNSLYTVYESNLTFNSSLVYMSNNNYSILSLLNSTNISKLLMPLKVLYVSPVNYDINVPANYLNKTEYLYVFIPYSDGWIIKGAKVLNASEYYGYMLFKIRIENSSLTLYNTLFFETFNSGIKMGILVFLIPIVTAIFVYIMNRYNLLQFLDKKLL